MEMFTHITMLQLANQGLVYSQLNSNYLPYTAQQTITNHLQIAIFFNLWLLHVFHGIKHMYMQIIYC